jgi:hypothetical protein
MPARRAAAMALCVPFSGVIRPNHTKCGPPGPIGQRRVSIPLGTTAISSAACCQEAAVCRLTAANLVPVPAAASSADSSHGVGGVCSVVSTGMGSIGAIATGRWCRLWLWMRSKCSAPDRANCSISVR